MSSDFWEVRLPDDWALKENDINHATYIEAPDGSHGVYVSAWRDTSRPLLAAMLEARAIERRNLPDVGGNDWEVVVSTEQHSRADVEIRSEYLSRSANYRIVSRSLGRGDSYVRLTYHDYNCRDYQNSAERSEPWVLSLRLLDGKRA